MILEFLFGGFIVFLVLTGIYLIDAALYGDDVCALLGIVSGIIAIIFSKLLYYYY